MDTQKIYDKCRKVIKSCETEEQTDMAHSYLLLVFDKIGKRLSLEAKGEWVNYMIESDTLCNLLSNKIRTLREENEN